MRNFLVAAVAGLMATACGLPFGIGQASTSQLINGAADNLASASGFEVKGKFTTGGHNYTFDLEYQKPDAADMVVDQDAVHLELLQVGGKAYYKSKDILTSTVGTDPFGQSVARAVGDKWFTSQDATPIDTTQFTDSQKVKANFLNTLGVSRKDNVSVNGTDTAELSTSDTIVNISESSPYHLVRVETKPGKTVSDVSNGDFEFINYGKSFGLTAPTDVWQIDEPSTWPAYYSVNSISVSRCDDPCVISAVIANKGGTKTGSTPSVLTFTLTSKADQSSLGTCKVTISPDISHGTTTTKSCSISTPQWTAFSGTYLYDATVDNPAYD